MKKYFALVFALTIINTGLKAQAAVGIGTTNPNAKASLDLGQSGMPLILPRLTTPQMSAVLASSENELGSIIYNTTEHQLYGYMRFRTPSIVASSAFRWQPISTGPRMLAWGVVDSGFIFQGVVTHPKMIAGSGNFNVTFDVALNSYVLEITTHTFNRDSMMVMVTPVGNGSWDQMVSIENGLNTNAGKALIKFTDASRVAAGWNPPGDRRRSRFNFVVYDLRKNPFP